MKHRLTSAFVCTALAVALLITPASAPVAAALPDPVLVAAGDISTCYGDGDAATALLLDRIPGTVVSLGDHAYPYSSAELLTTCYDRTWGRHKARTRPVVGNHEYKVGGGKPYFDYFGAAAGDPTKGYYSYDLAGWHVVALNSNCLIVACAAGSAQAQWLRADLTASAARTCQIALWHAPLFTSGKEHKPEPAMRDLFQILVDFGVEVNLTGHNHHYERFAPQLADGTADQARGVQEFVVGTGGASHYSFLPTPKPNSLVRENATHGVLALTLHPTTYDWRFHGIEGPFTDAGTAPCH
ncbi:hypothetical protein F4553_002926 [Allocatelliglobosispora scoriae]|uniref:Calcineurin-like phosphoesterase domain-containing protein n=1 Tax=Allocatelliglobosispora scoriae TaxID=643052 RepID=A0A841BKC1_9ACTN|nr:metallophosphoesterase [Allocatelliglobosispora scoriae]MBB5869547.1 hypothetical protein [Allocatelliglobosispora scoriae]